MNERYIFLVILLGFLLPYFLPLDRLPFVGPLNEALLMLQEYARQHVLLCLVPAFFIAGAISVFVNQQAVIKYFGARANKVLAYGVASVSGTVLAVCSCTVLPLFSGIYRRGAGIGPATAFLYSGPAINVLAIVLTARVLGLELGVARAAGAVLFSIIIGLSMHFIFISEERKKANGATDLAVVHEEQNRPLWKTGLYMASMVGILVFANWSGAAKGEGGLWGLIFRAKWLVTGLFFVTLALMLLFWFKRNELKEWASSTWTFARQILPLLFVGVLVAGALLGRPGHEGVIPSRWVTHLVGGNSVPANFFASIAGALMYFATLTEVPILQGLLGAGMGKGPALALLLAGPALSLPNMLVVRSVMGTTKTLVYTVLVVIMATCSGVLFGSLPAGS